MFIDKLSNEESYDLCKSMNFNSDEIRKYCGIYRISYEELISNAKVYAIDNIYNSITKVPKLELDLFYNLTFYKLIEKYKLLIEENNFSFSSNKETNDIILFIKNYLVSFFEKVNYDKRLITTKLKCWNLDYDNIVDIVIKQYIFKNKKTAKKDIDSIKSRFSHLTDKRIETTSNLLNSILNTKTDEEVIELVNSSIQNFKLDRIHNFCIVYFKDNYDEVEEILKRKYSFYMNYKKKNDTKLEESRKEAELLYLKHATEVIEGYVNSKFNNFNDYCKSIDVSLSQSRRYLEKVKANNIYLYNKFVYKEETIKKEIFNYNLSLAKVILNNIENGIYENDKYREFDLIDYYLLTKVDRRQILKAIKEGLGSDYAKVFGSFMSRYPDSNIINERGIEKILSERMIFGSKIDSEGRIIPGSGREITNDEKLYILSFLKDNNIPLYEEVYRNALKRYLNGNLENNKKNYKK